eukprot:4483369-Amphidinium_carterae.1
MANKFAVTPVAFLPLTLGWLAAARSCLRARSVCSTHLTGRLQWHSEEPSHTALDVKRETVHTPMYSGAPSSKSSPLCCPLFQTWARLNPCNPGALLLEHFICLCCTVPQCNGSNTGHLFCLSTWRLALAIGMVGILAARANPRHTVSPERLTRGAPERLMSAA